MHKCCTVHDSTTCAAVMESIQYLSLSCETCACMPHHDQPLPKRVLYVAMHGCSQMRSNDEDTLIC